MISTTSKVVKSWHYTLDHFPDQTVWKGGCTSYYKLGDKVIGKPGLHNWLFRISHRLIIYLIISHLSRTHYRILVQNSLTRLGKLYPNRRYAQNGSSTSISSALQDFAVGWPSHGIEKTRNEEDQEGVTCLWSGKFVSRERISGLYWY